MLNESSPHILETRQRRARPREVILSRLDPRNPFILDTRELGRRAGSMQQVSRTFATEVELGTVVASVAVGTKVELEARLEAVMEGVLVTGDVVVEVTSECSRCLDPLEWDQVARFSELFSYPDLEGDGREEDDEKSVLEDDYVVLEPTVRDAVVSALPFAPLCDDDCLGLCAKCGTRLADEPDHTHDEIDPRWAGLAGLNTNDEKER